MIHTQNSEGTNEEVVTLTEIQTLTSKEIILPVSTHSYGTGHVTWVLSDAENKSTILTATGTADAGCAATAIPTNGKVFIVSNATGQAVTILATGQTGVAVATGKTAIVRGNGTDFVRVSGDA